jgi:hypothetical protein
MELRVHLKVCEGCGCLWYRAQVETRVYCTACNERFKEFPPPQNRKRRGRPKKMILPTIFAVQASAEMIFQERLAAANPTSCVERAGFKALPPAPCTNRLSHARTATQMPPALLAAGAAGLRAAGGVQ